MYKPGRLSITLSAVLLLVVLGVLSKGALPAVVVNANGSSDRAGIAITVTGKPHRFDLTIGSSEGGVVVVPGEGVFAYGAGAVVELEAVAADGFRFVEWTGDAQSVTVVEAPHTTITVDADYSITAIFEEIPLSPPSVQRVLVITSTLGGVVTAPGEGSFAYDDGLVVDLVAEPTEGYCFAGWAGNVSTVADVTAAVTSIVMDGDYEIVAGFDSVMEQPHSCFSWWWIPIGAAVGGLSVYFLWWRRRRKRADCAERE